MNSKASVLSSVRARLTFWYTAVLALVLLVFSVSTYFYLARAARQRTDNSLSDTASSLISNFNSELGDENQPPDDAFREAARAFQFRDRQVIVFDDQRQVVVASNLAERLPLANDWFTEPAAQLQLRNVLDLAQRDGRVYATLSDSKNAIRVLAVPIPAGPQHRYVVVVANSLQDQEKALGQARTAFYLAVPLALLLASLGGYFLARKSLAPVVTMGEQAARIGASNLDERIPLPLNNTELARLAQIFNDLLQRLDESFAQQKRFMADASHELRTPVAVVCGESEVTLSQPRSEKEYRESLAIVNDEGQRLTRMVEDLFTLARADAGEYPMVSTDFYLDESINECVRSVRSLAGQKDLEILYQPPEKEIPFHGDESLVRRMVLNLLHNAIKFTPKGGQVRLSLKQRPQHSELVISDSGVGIPLAAQAQVFDRFFRVDKARSRDESINGSGAGLGLSIAKWVAELHGGSVILERSSDAGTTFAISLPSS